MERRLHQAKQFLIALAVVLLVVFLLQNLEAVEFRFLGWSISMSRAILMALIFLIGVGVGFALRARRPREPL
jgi:uncharacterized integral membrane protein